MPRARRCAAELRAGRRAFCDCPSWRVPARAMLRGGGPAQFSAVAGRYCIRDRRRSGGRDVRSGVVACGAGRWVAGAGRGSARRREREREGGRRRSGRAGRAVGGGAEPVPGRHSRPHAGRRAGFREEGRGLCRGARQGRGPRRLHRPGRRVPRRPAVHLRLRLQRHGHRSRRRSRAGGQEPHRHDRPQRRARDPGARPPGARRWRLAVLHVAEPSARQRGGAEAGVRGEGGRHLVPRLGHVRRRGHRAAEQGRGEGVRRQGVRLRPEGRQEEGLRRVHEEGWGLVPR